jgi:hypothetical protein
MGKARAERADMVRALPVLAHAGRLRREQAMNRAQRRKMRKAADGIAARFASACYDYTPEGRLVPCLRYAFSAGGGTVDAEEGRRTRNNHPS